MTAFIKRHILYLLLFLVAVVGLVVYTWQHNEVLYTLLFHLQNSMVKGEEYRQAILGYGFLAPLLFVGLQVLQVIFAPIPGEASGAFGGYLFGAGIGFVYSTIGLTIGSWIAFAIGRLLSDLIRKRLEHAKIYKKFNHLVEKGDFAIPFILFLIPGFPKDSLSYMLGMSHMPLPVFLFVAAVGRMPGTLLLSFQGAQVYEKDYWSLALLLLISLAVSLPCYLYRRRILIWLTQLGHHHGDHATPEPMADEDDD